MMKEKFKEFRPTSWAIDNKTSIYVLAIMIVIFGIVSYNRIPKEQFPEIVIPTIIVSTYYPGTSPADMENLVTRPLEKNFKSINDVKDITSNSVQDFSTIVVEFNTDIDVTEAKQRVKDAVDKTKKDLPNDLPNDPTVTKVDISEIPIMYVNLYGDYPLDKLKKYAEDVQDGVESLKEITRVDIVGALDREIQVDVDMYKMQAASLTFDDIDRAIANENVTIAGGTIDLHGMRRSIRVVGEFNNLEDLKNIVIQSSSGARIYLKDVATVKDSFKEQESFARLDGANVITLNVIKKSGQNLLDASDQIKKILKEMKADHFPKDLHVMITGDMSKFTRNTLTDLNNTIIIGFILVTIVLMFFMGLTNALFVGLSVPLSMALAYIILPGIDFTMNMLVMFSFIFALGIVVDDAIVVIENTHRIFKKTKMDIVTSAKFAAGEVFLPIFSGTLTTLAPFFPLAFWPGVTGKFMHYIPVTIIITLFMSLFVAYVINPVFAVSFMKQDDEVTELSHRKIFTRAALIAGAGAVIDALGLPLLGNIIIFIAFIFVFHNLWGYKIIRRFQHVIIPGTLNQYEKAIRWILQKRRPYYMLGGLVILFIFTFMLMGITKPKVVFFPDNKPNNIYAYIKMPVGTDVKVTDSVTRVVEGRIINVLGKNNPIVESVISNVALGVSESTFDFGGNTVPNKGKVSVNFVEYSKRHGESTTKYLDKIREAVKDIPGTEITVDKNTMGPPTGKPVNVELSSEDLDELIHTTDDFIDYLDSIRIAGAEEFKTDFESTKPEISVEIDRVRANMEGISTAQIGGALRTAVYGKESSKYREGEDQYPIELRFNKYIRDNIDRLMNLKITYRDMNSGILRQIPLSSVAKIKYLNSYGGINRKNLKRVITVTSNVLSGYTANEVVDQIRTAIAGFNKPLDVDIKITGEQEDQQESQQFLGTAMLIALCLILFILITQFNSISKPIIIVSEVLFSVIGALLGFIIFGMPISIIMTGMGLVALAGIVVRNGILLVEFTDVLLGQGMKTREAIIQAGKTRITPVLLTATSTILGLIPLAIGFNIDFASLFTHFNPHIYFGGDNVMFFGALSWTIIFGLTFATFLTLIFVPVMYYIMYAGSVKSKRRKERRRRKKIDFDKLY